MFRFRFGVEDLAQLRFAISPLFEAVSSLIALRDPASSAAHLPWVERTRGRIGGLDLGAALTMSPPKGYLPDFMTPPPSTPVVTIEEELAIVRSTPPEQVLHDVRVLLKGRRPPAVLQPFLDEPKRSVRHLADVLEQYWEVAIAPDWP